MAAWERSRTFDTSQTTPRIGSARSRRGATGTASDSAEGGATAARIASTVEPTMPSMWGRSSWGDTSSAESSSIATVRTPWGLPGASKAASRGPA